MKILAKLLISGICFAALAQLNPVHAQQTDLLPDFDNVKLRFGTGKIVNNKPEVSPIQSPIAGNASKWTVVQWSHFDHLTADVMTRNDPSTADPILGTAAYAFTAADQRSHVWIYHDSAGHPVYDLYEKDGNVGGAGGRNLFLATGLTQPVTLDHIVHFSMQAKVSRAAISYHSPDAKHTGAVLGMAFIGFAMNFPSPVDGSASVLFLQVDLAQSGNKTKFKSICTMSPSGRVIVTAGGNLDAVPSLLFQPDAGPPKPISFDVNNYIDALINRPMKCQMKGGAAQLVSLANVTMAEFRLKSIYVGLETQNADTRQSQAGSAPQGDVELGLQLSNLHLTE